MVYQLTRTGTWIGDRGLASQMQRAAVSIMPNLAEGFERNSPRDFHRFVVIAKASCGELRSQLYVTLDAGYMSVEQFDDIMQRCIELGRILGGLKASLRRPDAV